MAGAQDDAFDRLHEALQDGNYKKALKCADAGASRAGTELLTSVRQHAPPRFHCICICITVAHKVHIQVVALAQHRLSSTWRCACRANSSFVS